MKNKLILSTQIVFLSVFFSCLWGQAQHWTLTENQPWARSSGALEKTVEKSPDRDSRETVQVKHQAHTDWALSVGQHIPVRPGQIYQLQSNMSTAGTGNVHISVVTRDEKSDVDHWTYGSRGITGTAPWTTLQTTFIIPPGITSIEPRIVGAGELTVQIDGLMLEKTGEKPFLTESTPIVRRNKFLEITAQPHSGEIAVKDLRTGRIWNPAPTRSLVGLKKSNEKAICTLLDTQSMLAFDVFLDLDPKKPEWTLLLEATGPFEGRIAYPYPMKSEKGDRMIVPVNEGVGYPVEEKDIRVRRLIAYGGHGICMPFWGQVQDSTGAGMMGIIETPDDASIELADGPDSLLCCGLGWEPSQKKFRYARKVRYVFFDQGGHVAVCKRYREYAKKTGLYKPFTEKRKQNPNIDLLLGAANIWYWEKDKVELVQELKSAGFDRILWSGSGSAEQLKKMNEIGNVLTSRYDIYQDLMDPANFEAIGYQHGDWTTDAWPHDINWTSTDGTWRKGWPVDQKDKTKPRLPCAVICDSKALPYARKRITEELKTSPYTARFIDTTVASPWFECYHPDHPMTRSDSKKYKMELLYLIGQLGLVCGSETGHDASVPYCDYYEGMLSLGPYRVHESGRNMMQKVEEVPTQIERFQVNPAVRLPLWELVYHDCVVAHWYWGDYNNKLPDVWRKRDLINALYATPPMYMFTRAEWEQDKQRFIDSHKIANATTRATAYAEMTDHRILTDDRLVQQSHFSNGVIVTVNFSDKPFSLPNGTKINPEDFHVEK